MLKKILLLVLLFFLFTYITSSVLHMTNTNIEEKNTNSTASELVNMLKPTVNYGQVQLEYIRSILNVNQTILNCRVDEHSLDPQTVFNFINNSLVEYSIEMKNAWLSENYSKYLVLLSVYEEYQGLRYFITNPSSNNIEILEALKNYCVVNYTLQNIDALHNILNEHYEVKLPDHYTFSKIEKLIIDKWRNNSKTYLPKYDYRISYLATPQTSFNWALYNAWLELFNCSYLLSFNITPTEARIGINETLKELRKPENILLLIMLEEYLSQDIRDLQIQSTEMGSMSSMWKKCTSSTMYKDINFSDFSYILYYAWLENSHIYEILASNSDK